MYPAAVEVAQPTSLTPPRRERSALARGLLFLLGIPLLAGVLIGASRAGVAQYFPWGIGVAFWVLASTGAWLCFHAASAVTGVLLKPWSPPLWVILAVGAVVGSVPARYLVYGAAVLLQDFMLDGRTPQRVPPFRYSVDFLLYYLQVWIGVYLMWIVSGLVYDRWLGGPRYSRPAADQAIAEATPAAPPTSSALLDRLPPRIGRNVIALEAEDHYVRVHTDAGSTLIHGRLSDSIAELTALDGVRVHRSYWVRRSAVSRASAHGKGLMLRLSNGMDVPVSQGYRELARQAGIVPTQPG